MSVGSIINSSPRSVFCAKQEPPKHPNELLCKKESPSRKTKTGTLVVRTLYWTGPSHVFFSHLNLVSYCGPRQGVSNHCEQSARKKDTGRH